MKTPKLTFEETLKLMLDGWQMFDYGVPTYRRTLVKGTQERCGLHNPVSSRLFRSGYLDKAYTGKDCYRYKLSDMGRFIAKELK